MLYIGAASGRAAAGSGELVVVTAAPGLGRTALAGQAVLASEEAGLLCATVRPDREVSSLPLSTLEEVFTALGLDAIHPDGEEPSPSREQELALTLRSVLASPPEGRTGTCLVLDDAHCADAWSLRLIGHALRLLSETPALIVLTAVPALAQGPARAALNELLAGDRAVLLPLGPLDTADSVDLLAEHGSLFDDPDFLLACAEHAGGSPALLTDLLRDATAAPRTLSEVSEWVPPRVLAAVQAQLDHAGAGPTALARALFVLDDQASLRRAAALAGLGRRAAEDAADALLAAAVCRSFPELRFTAPLVRAAVGASFEPFEGQRWHRRAAALLYGEDGPGAAIVDHIVAFAPGGEPWVIEPLMHQAAHAAATGDCSTAAKLLGRALEEPPPPERLPEVLADLAVAESRAGLPAAPSRIDAALAWPRPPLDRLRLLRERARLMWLTGRLPEAVTCSEQALAVAEQHAHSSLLEEIKAELLAVASMHDIGSFSDRAGLGELLERAKAAWVPDAPSLAATLATVLPLVTADVRLLPPLIDRAVEGDLWRMDAAPYGLRVDFVLGAMGFADQLERARELIGDAVALAELEDDPVRIGRWHYLLAEAEYGLGNLHAAVDAGARAVDRRSGAFVSWLGFSAATLTHAHLDRGDLAAARAAAALADDRVAPDQLAGMAAAIGRSRLLAATGDAPAGLALALEVGARITALGHRDSALAPWRPTAIAVATAAGDLDVARQLTSEETETARRMCSASRLGRALHLAAPLVAPSERRDLLREAVACLTKTSRRLVLASALADLGIEEYRLGDTAQARRVLSRAREMAQSCGAAPLGSRILAGQLATGARPRRVAQSGLESLTPTERRIVDLVRRGLTNRQVAEALFIASRTVEWHLGRAYGKLGVHSRAQLASTLDLHHLDALS